MSTRATRAARARRIFTRLVLPSALLANGMSTLPVAADQIDLGGLGKAAPLRLRMELRVLSTSDSHEDAGNSEDEIYYGLSGFTVRSGSVKHLPKKVVRPKDPSKDVWEMGSGSNGRLTRLPFAANMKLLDAIGLLLVITEQDNVWAPSGSSNFQKINAAVSALKQALSGDDFLATNTGVDDDTIDGVIADMGHLLNAGATSTHQPLGLVAIRSRGPTLEVKGIGPHTEVVSRPDARTAEFELTGFESRYRLTLVLERDEEPRPKTRVFLDRSEDACGAPNLFVESKNGNVLILKGQDPVDVFIEADRYHWHCGDLGSDDSSNAPDTTNVAVTTRDATGDRIRWEWFAEHTVSPDYP